MLVVWSAWKWDIALPLIFYGLELSLHAYNKKGWERWLSFREEEETGIGGQLNKAGATEKRKTIPESRTRALQLVDQVSVSCYSHLTERTYQWQFQLFILFLFPNCSWFEGGEVLKGEFILFYIRNSSDEHLFLNHMWTNYEERN